MSCPKVERLRKAIEESLLLMETPAGTMDAKILLAEIYAATEPPVGIDKDCGCGKKAKAARQAAVSSSV